MKITVFIALFLVLSILLCGEIDAQTSSDAQTIFLDNYFANRKYEVWKEKLITGERRFTTAVHYIDPMNRIVDDAVVFTIINGKVVPYLFFKPNKILNGEKLSIIDLSEHPYDFYGWQITYSYPKNNKHSPGFATTSFADSGKRVSDGPTIAWNPTEDCFEKREFPLSE